MLMQWTVFPITYAHPSEEFLDHLNHDTMIPKLHKAGGNQAVMDFSSERRLLCGRTTSVGGEARCWQVWREASVGGGHSDCEAYGADSAVDVRTALQGQTAGKL